MRISFCLHRYFPHGGRERDGLHIAQACAERGHSVRFLVARWEGPPPAGPIEVRELPAGGWTNHGSLLRFVDEVRGILARDPGDITVGLFPMPGLDILFGASLCFEARGRRIARWRRWLPRYLAYARLERSALCPSADTVVLALTRRQIEECREVYGTPEERFRTLPPGVVVDRALPTDDRRERDRVRRELGIDGESRVLLSVGSHYRGKGLDRTFLAFASLSEEQRRGSILLVAGRDRLGRWRRRARRLRIESRVRLLGPRDDVPRLLLAADVLVLPSRWETAGMVIVEALTMGRPVVASGECGYAEHVTRSGAGRVLDVPFRQDRFDRALAEVLYREDLGALRERALAYSRGTDLRGLPESAASIIEEVAREKASASAQRLGAGS